MKRAGKRTVEENAPASDRETGPECRSSAGPCIVAIGASAGGLEAFEQFFSHLPADTGLAFVLVPHLEPTHKGMMPELVARHTKMKAREAEDGMEVRPNCIYVIPPNADLAILHGRLQVLEPAAPRGRRTPIDFFFRHLAEDQKEKAIGVILSGMGSDGTLGVKAIKEQLGMVMAQDPASAKYDGMPHSAIQTGQVDYIAPAQELPAKLIQYIHHIPPPPLDQNDLPEAEPATAMQKVFVLLRAHSGNDFSCYKQSTINRRIERRMGVHQFNSLTRYVRFLQENPQEVALLNKELLIGVTNFFRDAGLFETLRGTILPHLLQDRVAEGPLRVWNVGCSTGEEAYSLAIVLLECLKDVHRPHQGIQVFATDIDNDAVEKARQGIFAAGIAADVSEERLRNWFVQADEAYRIRSEIRDVVVFARQNILVDPPFTKLDILCCRNLLIYLNVETQKKVLTLMHYALNPGGLLILGTAESIGGLEHLFAPADGKWKVFRRVGAPGLMGLQLPVASRPRASEDPTQVTTAEEAKGSDMDWLYAGQRAMLELYAPPSIIVTSEGDVVYVNSRTGKYLELASGKANLNAFAIAREGLREELGAALVSVASEGVPLTVKGVKLKTNGGETSVNFSVRPLTEISRRDLLLVTFQDTAAEEGEESPSENGPAAGLPERATSTSELDEELRRTRERLRRTVQEMQATQEELRSANEELQSSNEELQSSNEELNSSKEEMQSLNEEMQTVNTELHVKMEQLSQSNSDMRNLLNGIDIATVFLDNDLQIKRFTPEATKIVNLTAGDTGRPLSHFTTRLRYDRLVQDAKEVLERLVSKELQVETDDGRWYNLRILPYRTLDNVIDGVVMTFADVTSLQHLNEELRRAQAAAEEASGLAGAVAQLRRTEETLRQSEARYRALVTATSDALYHMSPDWSEMRHLHSRGFLADMPHPSGDWLQRYIPPEDQPKVMAAIQKAIRTKGFFELEHRVRRTDGSVGWTISRAVPLLGTEGEIVEWFGAASDITARKQAEEAPRQSANELKQ